MLEYLPWIVAGLAVGLFVGYAFGKYRGASEASEQLEGEPASARQEKEDGSSAEAEAVVYVRRGRSGSHYHKQGCRHLRGRGYRMAKAAAIKRNYRPCPKCRP